MPDLRWSLHDLGYVGLLATPCLPRLWDAVQQEATEKETEMFLKGESGYTRGGTQWGKGPFLMIFSLSRFTHPDADRRELRACVRTVRLSQCGQFMMGSAKVGPHKITLSGCYGDDGLPDDPDPYPGLWETLLPLPPELVEEFWKGGGHNTSGAEGPAVKAWAIANEKALRKAGTCSSQAK